MEPCLASYSYLILLKILHIKYIVPAACLISKDFNNLPMDKIALPVLPPPEDGGVQKSVMMELPILPPHLLTAWLLQSKRLAFNVEAAAQFWDHHRAQGCPWMRGPTFQCPKASAEYEPFSIYGDECEYTVSKQKILMIFCST